MLCESKFTCRASRLLASNFQTSNIYFHYFQFATHKYNIVLARNGKTDSLELVSFNQLVRSETQYKFSFYS